MKSDPRLHHYCQNIVKGHLGDAVELYELLGFDVVFTPDQDSSWIMVGQKQLRFAIQITEVADTPISDINIKKRTHVAFISENPQFVLDKVEAWTQRKNLTFRQGGWSDTERF